MKILKRHAVLTSAFFLVFVNINIFAAEIDASVVIEYKNDDNILSDQNQIIDANILVVAPELSWLIESGNNSYEFILDGEIGEYEGSNEDNYADSGLSASGDFELNSKHRINFLGSIENSHDDRGTGFSRGSGAQLFDVDTFTESGLVATYSFGREETAGQLDFSVAVTDIDYDARYNDFGTDLMASRDRSDTRLSVSFTYGMTVKTNLVTTLSTAEVDYDTGIGLSNTEDNIQVGVTWQGTAKTTGSASIGYRDRTLDDNSSNSSGSTWAVGILWSPLSYSTINFTTNKNSEESIGVGNFRIVTSFGVSWEHEWSDRISSDLSVEFSDTDFDGTNTSDESTSIQASLNYQLKDWLGLRFSYTNTERDTNDVSLPFTYDREIIGISLIFDFDE